MRSDPHAQCGEGDADRDAQRNVGRRRPVVSGTQQPHGIGRKGRKGGESSAESCDEQPSCRSRIRGLQQNADQQRSRGVDRERSGRKTQQRVPSEQSDGEHIADDASGGASQAHGEKFTNHNLNICIILRMCKFKQKMITNRSIICRNKWNFCHIWRRGLLAPAVRAMRRRFPSARGVGGCIGARRLRFSRAGRSRERGGMPRKRRAAA